MKAPTCRICRKEHWNNEPHQWEKASPLLLTKPRSNECAGCENRDKRIAELERQLGVERQVRELAVTNAEDMRNQLVTMRNHLVTERSQRDVTKVTTVTKPKRDRAGYMRRYRAIKETG
jgi:hypothetical protein